MQIELNEYNISEDWGWFVDTETLLLINQSKNKYNNINKLEKITEEDEDYYDDIESLKKTGICPETIWSYDISKFKST